MVWNLKFIIIALWLVSLLSACSDGGGTGTSLRYTGSVALANLTPTNSASLIGDAYTGGNSGIIVSGVTAGLTRYKYDASRRPRSLILTTALTRLIERAATGDTLARPETAATVSNIPSSTLNGDCGGHAIVDGSFDDVNGTLSLTANLNNYCMGGTILNGTVGASGSAVTDIQGNIVISSITVTLAYLSAAQGGDSFIADGTLHISPQAGHSHIDKDIVITLNMLFKDNVTSKVYKLEDFTITRSTVNGAISYDDISLAGRFYDPDEGYISLSTLSTLRVINKGDWPSSGSLRAAGDQSSATLTAQSNSTYRLDVDIDGDGNLDSTDNGLWANI